MTPPKSFVDELRQYIGLRIRIHSDVTRWEGRHFPTLTSVTEGDEGAVWCHADNGMSWRVVPKGLTIELEPAVGTYDVADVTAIGEAVRDALERHGPTPRQRLKRCNCIECTRIHDADEREREAYYTKQRDLLDAKLREKLKDDAPPQDDAPKGEDERWKGW